MALKTLLTHCFKYTSKWLRGFNFFLLDFHSETFQVEHKTPSLKPERHKPG